MATNYAGVPVEIVKDMIAAKNPRFQNYRTKYTLSTPSTNTTNNRNTVVTATPTTTAISGTAKLYYNRQTIQQLLTAKMPTGKVSWGAALSTVPTTTSALLPRINTWLGVQLTAADIVDSLVSTGVLGLIQTRTVLLTASNTNLLWTGAATFNIVP